MILAFLLILSYADNVPDCYQCVYDYNSCVTFAATDRAVEVCEKELRACEKEYKCTFVKKEEK